MLRTFLIAAASIFAMGAQAGPLHDAVRDGNLDRIHALLAAGSDVNATDPLVGTPLHMAAMTGRPAVAEALLAAGAEINAVGGMTGQTPLQIAVSTNAAVAQLLINHGADVAVADSEGNTPLHMAASAGMTSVVTLLLDRGADIGQPNGRGVEPVELAGANGHFDLVALFMARGALPDTDVGPVSALLAEANAEHGRDLFASAMCAHCHAVERDGEKVGPNLWNVVGRKIASGAFHYSPALARVGGDWSYEALNAWLASPQRFAPGNLMSLAPLQGEGTRGVLEASDRADLIAFLRLQHDDPVPDLPR